MKGGKALANHIYSIFAAIKASFETQMNFKFLIIKDKKRYSQGSQVSINQGRILGNTHESIYAKNLLP